MINPFFNDFRVIMSAGAMNLGDVTVPVVLTIDLKQCAI
jgi:hypothetical protein